MNSLKTKLIIIYAAVVLVVMIVSGTVMLWNMRQMELSRVENQLRSRANAINAEVVQQYPRGQFLTAATWGVAGHEDYSIQGMIMNSAGIPIAPQVFTPMRFNNQAIAAALVGGEGFSVGPGPDLPGQNNQQWISFAMPVTHDGEDFIIFTRISTQFMSESLVNMAFTIIITVLASLMLIMVLMFFLAGTITAPIVRITRHAKKIASGDFSQKITVKSKDEIGQLSYNFNHMAQELSSTLRSMASERNKREAILQNTSHGVLAYDASGVLIHANNAGIELLHDVDVHQMSLDGVLEFLGIEPDDIYNLQPEEIRESTYQNKDFFMLACVTSYNSQAGNIDGYVIVLQDISRQMKLDNMRKEFVANVSHELRTPLTSIRTYTETLIDGAVKDPGIAMDFLKVIDEEANRMTLLVSDLLELSRIDSKQSALEMDVVDLVALLRLTVRQSQFLATTKGQHISIDASSHPCFIEANASRINQVITNILSNSIKYSSINTTIYVTMETTEKFYRIFIRDEGMGIPEESISRIFERFYRVDKARARAMGGTGLGLAIVKEIMEEHGGTVHVTSQPGQGTTMVLRFNKYTGESEF